MVLIRTIIRSIKKRVAAVTHKVLNTEEWEEEYCDRCDHPVSSHYDTPKDVFDPDGHYIYTAEGCMVLGGTRKLKGNNPYLRCECLHSK